LKHTVNVILTKLKV